MGSVDHGSALEIVLVTSLKRLREMRAEMQVLEIKTYNY